MTPEQKVIKLTKCSINIYENMMKVKQRRLIEGISPEDKIELLWEMLQLASNIIHDIDVHINRNIKEYNEEWIKSSPEK